MPSGDELRTYALLVLALIVVLALAGASLHVRHGKSSGKLSMRSIIRALLGHRACDRNHKDPPP